MKAVQWTVFIDMLGFKKLNSSVANDDQAQQLINFMTTNRDVLVEHEATVSEYYKQDKIFNLYDWYDVKSAFISDSIVVTFKPKEVESERNSERVLMHSANALMLITMRLGNLMHKCLIEKEITFRGGISTKYCDIHESFAVGAGLSCAAEAEGRATHARIILADDVLSNTALMRKVRDLFKMMYGDSQLINTENGIKYINALELMLATTDVRSPSVKRAIQNPNGRAAVIAMKDRVELFLSAQKALIKKSISEFYSAYRANYSDPSKRKSYRRILEKYFWLRRYHNAAANSRGFQNYLI